MMDYVSFWADKTLVEIAIWFIGFIIILVFYGLTLLPDFLEQRSCKHLKIREDSQCNAWCRSCGKNLGFIGNLENRNERESSNLGTKS